MTTGRLAEILGNLQYGEHSWSERWDWILEMAAEIRRLQAWIDELTGGIHWDE